MSDVWHDEPHMRERWILFAQRKIRPLEKPIKTQVAFTEANARKIYTEYEQANRHRPLRYQYIAKMIHQTINSVPMDIS